MIEYPIRLVHKTAYISQLVNEYYHTHLYYYPLRLLCRDNVCKLKLIYITVHSCDNYNRGGEPVLPCFADNFDICNYLA